MKRFASHYILFENQKIFRQHVIELDDQGCISGIFPLTEEIAATSFFNGILFPVSQDRNLQPEDIRKHLSQHLQSGDINSIYECLSQSGIICSSIEKPVVIFHLDGINLLSPELSTGNGCSNCYIQRL